MYNVHWQHNTEKSEGRKKCYLKQFSLSDVLSVFCIDILQKLSLNLHKSNNLFLNVKIIVITAVLNNF